MSLLDFSSKMGEWYLMTRLLTAASAVIRQRESAFDRKSDSTSFQDFENWSRRRTPTALLN
jgi:hypothetical protein